MKNVIIALAILFGGVLITSPSSDEIFAQDLNKTLNDNVKVEVIKQLNQQQAKELLEIYNVDVNYIYQGDESDFKALEEIGLQGYVFLPDIEGDLGLFVDKNSAKIYYFHPSGYFELAF